MKIVYSLVLVVLVVSSYSYASKLLRRHPRPVSVCPDGQPPVNCFIQPCLLPRCPAIPRATCVDDYCGGCNARWYLNGVEVTSQCNRPSYRRY